MKITKEIIKAIEQGKDKVKKTEATYIPSEFRKDSAWLDAVYDIIDRTALAIRDKLEQV